MDLEVAPEKLALEHVPQRHVAASIGGAVVVKGIIDNASILLDRQAGKHVVRLQAD